MVFSKEASEDSPITSSCPVSWTCPSSRATRTRLRWRCRRVSVRRIYNASGQMRVPPIGLFPEEIFYDVIVMQVRLQ